MSQSGFAPIFIIILVITLALGIGGATYYEVRKNKTSETSASLEVETPVVPAKAAPYPEPIPDAKTPVSQKLAPQQKPQSSPSFTASEVHGETRPSQNLGTQFSAIERELAQGKASGSLLGEEHYARIVRDLDSLEQGGYSKELISRLRALALDLVPYLEDKAVSQSSTSVSSQSATTPVQNACTEERPVLAMDITDFGKIRKITAPGSPSHEGPKGHSFIWTEKERVPVYMPIAGVLDSGSYSKDNTESPAQYLLFFTVKDSCNFQLKFDHIDEPVPPIKAEFAATPAVADSRTSPATRKLEFKAGDLVGYTSGTAQAGTWDFGLYDTKEKGVLASQYNSYGMHGYAVCWVDYYAEGKQEKYRALLEGPKLLCSF